MVDNLDSASWKFSLIVLAWIFMFRSFCNSEKAPNYTFVHEAISAPQILYYDYIIVGGGTSGCPLAATLSENATVLVLERGGSPYGNPNITNMANFPASLTDTSPDSPSQQFISEDGVYNSRARVLGGGSAINAGFYTRTGDDCRKEAGWSQELVNESYAWVEKKVAFEPHLKQWQSAVRDGLIEVGVLPYNGFTYDHIYGTKIGGTVFDGDGHRHTAADLLEYSEPRNIAVYLHATVHKVLLTGKGKTRRRPRAYGVIFEDALGCRHKAYLKNNSKNEIILSAGALGSPQLLMLSGIGPSSHLQHHGIPVVVDQPLVGKGMADNPMNALVIPSPIPIEISLIQVVGITHFGSCIETSSHSNFAYASAQRPLLDYVLHSSQITGQASEVRSETNCKEFDPVNFLANATQQSGAILEKVIGPLSTGELKLRTKNPNDNPSVKFNYFKEPEDLNRCFKGMKTVTNVINSRAFSKFRYKNMSAQALLNLTMSMPLNLRRRHPSRPFSLKQFCKETVMTIWHYHGGCQVGKVVDHDYKVLGVNNMRVIDGSTFISSPGSNPQATVMMLGRYMGRRILQDRLQAAGSKQ